MADTTQEIVDVLTARLAEAGYVSVGGSNVQYGRFVSTTASPVIFGIVLGRAFPEIQLSLLPFKRRKIDPSGMHIYY